MTAYAAGSDESGIPLVEYPQPHMRLEQAQVDPCYGPDIPQPGMPLFGPWVPRPSRPTPQIGPDLDMGLDQATQPHMRSF